MSAYSKFLVRDIVVPTGGYDFATNLVTVTLPADTYDDILHLGYELENQLDTDYPGLEWDVDFDQTGKCYISADGAWTITWGSTTTALSYMLGYDETESVSSNILTSTNGHQYGWYPGVITHGYNVNRGAGLVSGPLWVPVDQAVRAWSGSRLQRTVELSTKLARRVARFDIINRDEVGDVNNGLAAIWWSHTAKSLAWYLDRSVGSCGSYGTQGTPGEDNDDDCDYWVVDLVEQPDASPEPSNPSLYMVEMVLNGRGA